MSGKGRIRKLSIVLYVLPVALGLLSPELGGHGPHAAMMADGHGASAMAGAVEPVAGADTSAYRIVPTGAACTFSSANPAHGMVVDYASAGFTIFPGADRSGPHVSFRFEGLGRNGGVVGPEPLSGQRADGGALEVELGAVRMRYRNDARGMRHDVVVQDRPDGDGRLEARFRLEGGLPAMQTGPDEVVFHRFDEQAVALVPAMRYSGLKAWDAQGRVLPSTMELQDDDLVLAVVDDDAEYPITIDPISTAADLEVTGTQAGESLGYSVATAGDVNGDGYSDILVGSPFWNTPFANAGRVQLFLGSATGIPATPAWTYQGIQVNDSLGFSVSSAGDINGDGYSDVAIGAPGRTSGRGAVLVFTGSGGGLGASPAYTLNGDQNGCAFGWSVALAGDVNNDSPTKFSDLLVGAPKYDPAVGQSNRGRVYCYHGPTMTLGQTLTGTSNNAQFGYSVAGAGDLDGDGVSDVAIGEPFRIKGILLNSGAVHLFKGNSGTGLSATAATMQQPGAANANVGFSISSAGDMDGDGLADLVVGAPGATSGNGAIYVFRGAATSVLVNTTPASLVGTSAERLGHSVALAGDVNGDGYADIVVGSPGNAGNNGKVQVYRGDATVALDDAHRLWTQTGPAGAGRWGAAVCTGGDVNGDGISDLLLAAPDQGGMGAVKVFHGAPDLPATTASWSIQGTANYQQVGECMASAGDVNGDGYSDVLVGVPGGAGQKGEVRLFLGSATGLPATPSWTKQGENVEDRFGHAVASAGDVNGDGYSDVLIGAPAWPSGVSGQWRGRAYLFLGSAGGLSGTAAWSSTGSATESRHGISVSSAGDVNGDGYSDVIIGACMLNNGPGTGEGAAYVYHGSGTGLSAVADWTMASQQHRSGHSSLFGACVSLAGDVNGDGYDDVIIGDPYFEHPSGDVNIGGAFVFHGSSAGLSAAPNWAAYGAGSSDYFGGSLGYAGDVNGDGYSDVIIGAYAKGANSRGGAYVYHGSPSGGLGGAAAWAIDGVLNDDQLGMSVCSAGDVNGDGYSDVVVGAFGMDFLTFTPSYVYIQNSGGVQVHLGSAAGLSATLAWSVHGANTDDRVGGCVALAGDVNGDGYSDIIYSIDRIPSYTDAGGAFLHLGNAGHGLPARTYQYRSDLTTQVRTSNGTFEAGCQWGIGQFARSSMGRSKVKLAWHNEGHGPVVPTYPFNNNSTTLSGQAVSWTDSGTPGVLLTQLLSTPPGGTAHPQWRARIRHHPATALDGRVFGRWHMQGVHDLQVPSIKTEFGMCGVLPVELLSVRGACAGNAAHLEWATATERDCAHFVVERSSDMHAWQQLAVVACAGNSQSPRRYAFRDASPPVGTAYYRLRQVDTDGSAHLLPTVTVEHCAQAAGSMRVWPNPVSDLLHVDHASITGHLSEGTLIEVIDATGRLVASLPAAHDAGTVSIGMAGMAAGVYAVVARSPDGTLLGHARVVRE